ncbi:hypothetical protein AUEXF2481DRAFT_26791 [Aureobasidium subglaciale EXF-2481]|uniref:RING-type domain-containing protein n=1 Tax=Aureobasidium subglaciale (strain EXF-2481) TaxID=1043005 RepID=A0A074YKQ4_AURSE|nr:uncharacterized protein AUEXF2481DRAFT_26791 [Aureobasidium subglaciale EXF-2481]KEQ98413.1 hypothetical protein AUEXF2481DRAFT_26791 [Aureobasidium subglaciale EXF-2481]
MAFPNPKAQLKYTSIRNVLSASGPAVVDEQTPSPVDTEPTVKEQSHSVVAEYQHLEICHICEGEEILIALPCEVECSVPESVAIQALPQEQAKILEKKIRELTTPPNQRCYCAKRNCSAFIPPALVFIDDLARCGECGTSTCRLCRASQHEGECAGPSEGDQQAHDQMQKEGYRHCSYCRRMVERNGGCSHMTCVCGHEWCIHCGGLISTCNGCGHLEPDIVGVREEDQWVLDDDAAIPIDPADDEELQQRFQMSVLDNVILQMRLLQRPASADNSTMNFNQIFRVQGYEGPLIWYRPDGHPVFGQSDEDFPSGRDLAFSDVVLFHVFNAAELVSDAEEEPEGGVQYAADDDYVM